MYRSYYLTFLIVLQMNRTWDWGLHHSNQVVILTEKYIGMSIPEI